MPKDNTSPVATSSTDPEAVRKRRQHKACDYCRTHRIKCVSVEGDAKCKKCLDLEIVCDKSSAPPKDSRPRSRLLFKHSGLSSQHQGVEPTYEGSSSLSVLSWKLAPRRPDVINKFRALDDRLDLYRGSVGCFEHEGVLFGQSGEEAGKVERPPLVSVSMIKVRLMQELGAETVLTALYETCRDRIIPFFPVISVSESLLSDKADEAHVNIYAPVDPHSTPPTPLPHIVRMIHCAIASRSRDVPEPIQRSLQSAMLSLMNGPEMIKIISTRSLGSIQVLLSLSMCDDLNGANGNNAMETVWQNVGTAIQMGMAIGLHRNISPGVIPYFQLNRRFRVWGACVSMGRWQSLRFGRGLMIDLDTCDAPPPRLYADGVREGYNEVNGTHFPCFRFFSEFTSLSILMGRTYRLVSNPLGLQASDDLLFFILQADIDIWTNQLPTEWPYSINMKLAHASELLNLFIVALEFTLQRSFLWPRDPIPPGLTFCPTQGRWLALYQRTEQAIYWLSTPDGAFYLDVWTITVYPAFCCVLVSLKATENSMNDHSRGLLDMANIVIQQWASRSPNDPVRSRLASVSSLLRSAVADESLGWSVLEDLFTSGANSSFTNTGDTVESEQLGLDDTGIGSFAF